MNVFARSIPFVILLGGVIGLMGLMSLREDPPSSPREEQIPLVQTDSVQSCEDGFSLRVDGNVVPFREMTLAARVSGQVIAKSPQARAGNFVRQGALLFEIDPSDYELEAKRLQELVKQASTSIEVSDVEKSNTEDLIKFAEERLELQKKEVARFERLMERGATSTAQLEKARSTELQSLDSLEKLKGQINLIRANRSKLLQERATVNASLDQAILNLSRTKITSPADGMIVEDMADRDDYVQVGAPLVRIEDTSKAEVRFNLRMDQLRWLWKTPAATAAVAASPQDNYRLPEAQVNVGIEIDGNHFQWKARLDRYDGAGINDATRTIPLIAIVDNPADVTAVVSDDALPLPGPPTLLRNTFVTVEIPVAATMDLVKIPPEGLRPDGRVWTIKDGKLDTPDVRVAATASDAMVILLSDPAQLAAGDRIIVSPLPPLPQVGMTVDEQFSDLTTKSATMTVSEKLDRKAL